MIDARRLLAVSTAVVAVGSIVMSPELSERWKDSPRVSQMDGSTRVTTLDAVPGFGLSAASQQRDELIATYESFQRERAIQSCMQDAGHVYIVTTAMPEPVVHSLASSPEVQAANRDAGVVAVTPMPPSSPEAEPGDNAYYLALYNEPKRGVVNGEDANGDGVIAEGGCYGQAWDSTTSVWQLEKDLQSELESLTESTSDDLNSSRGQQDYENCVRARAGQHASDLAEAEDGFARGLVSFKALQEITKQCQPAWDQIRSQALRERQLALVVDSPEFEHHMNRSTEIHAEALTDATFLEQLAQEGAR